MSTLTTNKKRAMQLRKQLHSPIQTLLGAAKGMEEFYQTFALSAGFFVSSKGGRK
jgi:hypothetical protein